MKSAQDYSPAHHLDPAHTSTTNDPPLGIAHASHVVSGYERSRSKALELFAQHGFGQVSMRDLASHLGMNAGSLYHHFPSKQHLLFELLEEFYEDLGAILEDCARSQEEPANALLLLIRARLALHHEHPYHGRLAQRDTVSLDGERRQMIGEMKGQFGINLMRLMGLTTREADPKLEAAGHAVAQLIINLPDWLEGHPLSEVEREHVAELLIMGMVNRLCLRSSVAC